MTEQTPEQRYEAGAERARSWYKRRGLDRQTHIPITGRLGGPFIGTIPTSKDAGK